MWPFSARSRTWTCCIVVVEKAKLLKRFITLLLTSFQVGFSVSLYPWIAFFVGNNKWWSFNNWTFCTPMTFQLTSSQWSYWYRDLLNFNSNSSKRLFSSSALIKSSWIFMFPLSLSFVASSQSGENSKFGLIAWDSAEEKHKAFEWEQIALNGIARLHVGRTLAKQSAISRIWIENLIQHVQPYGL